MTVTIRTTTILQAMHNTYRPMASFMMYFNYQHNSCGCMSLAVLCSKSARYVCSDEKCVGSEGDHFIRIHIPGAREAQTVRY